MRAPYLPADNRSHTAGRGDARPQPLLEEMNAEPNQPAAGHCAVGKPLCVCTPECFGGPAVKPEASVALAKIRGFASLPFGQVCLSRPLPVVNSNVPSGPMRRTDNYTCFTMRRDLVCRAWSTYQQMRDDSAKCCPRLGCRMCGRVCHNSTQMRYNAVLTYLKTTESFALARISAHAKCGPFTHNVAGMRVQPGQSPLEPCCVLLKWGETPDSERNVWQWIRYVC